MAYGSASFIALRNWLNRIGANGGRAGLQNP
jgi:hypothetical protein